MASKMHIEPKISYFINTNVKVKIFTKCKQYSPKEQRKVLNCSKSFLICNLKGLLKYEIENQSKGYDSDEICKCTKNNNKCGNLNLKLDKKIIT